MAEQLDEYKKFVREHPAQVKRMEEVARLVAMFLPVSKFGKYSEMVQESTYSVLGLTSLFHDRILQSKEDPSKPLIRTAKEQTARIIRLVLTLFAHVEVVLEMAGRLSGGEAAHMSVVYLIECIKALGRLVLLAQARAGSLLIHGGQFLANKAPQEAESGADGGEKQSEVVQAADDVEKNMPGVGRRLGSGSDESQAVAVSTPAKWQGRRSGKTITLPESLRSYDNVSADADTPSPQDAVSKAAGLNSTSNAGGAAVSLGAGPEDQYLRMAGEVIHILRPVIYVSAVRRAGPKNKSWTPFVLSLILEVLSIRCASVASSGKIAASSSSMPKEEIFARAVKKLLTGANATQTCKDEMGEIRRRRGLFAMYLMRSPLFDSLTLPIVQRIAGAFSGLPGVGESIESMLIDTLFYYHRLHFYYSAS